MLIPSIVSILLIILDQFLKSQAALHLSSNSTVVLIPHVLGLTYVENRGAAWGIFAGNKLFLVVFTAILLGVILWVLFTNRIKAPLLRWSAVLFFTGGVGNFIDRLLSGYVVDYLQFLFINFPVFNLADICIVTGFGLFIIDMIHSEMLNRRKKEKE